jgi:hypothetical protein
VLSIFALLAVSVGLCFSVPLGNAQQSANLPKADATAGRVSDVERAEIEQRLATTFDQAVP